MFNIQNYSPRVKVEEIKSFDNLKTSDFNMPLNYVVYFETTHNFELTDYIDKNYSTLKQNFKECGKNFIYLPLIESSHVNLEKVLDFYIPQLNPNLLKNVIKQFSEIRLKQAVLELNITASEIEYRKRAEVDTSLYLPFLNYINYNGEIKSGFFFYENGFYVVENPNVVFDNYEETNFDYYFNAFIQSIKGKSEYDFIEDFEDLPLQQNDLYELLDEDTKIKIEEIKQNLQKVKNNGQLLFMLPILKNILDDYADEVNLESISTIEIDKFYTILLPYFNKEIVLSHLTKSIYFLFLKHPEGIFLKELSLYKEELLSIYLEVSNQIDYNRMVVSIEDLISPESKAIYTHISRIKSALFKIMDTNYAKHYTIVGRGDDVRKINFSRDAVLWESEI